MYMFFFFQAEDGIRDLVRSRGLGDVYKRHILHGSPHKWNSQISANLARQFIYYLIVARHLCLALIALKDAVLFPFSDENCTLFIQMLNELCSSHNDVMMPRSAVAGASHAPARNQPMQTQSSSRYRSFSSAVSKPAGLFKSPGLGRCASVTT